MYTPSRHVFSANSLLFLCMRDTPNNNVLLGGTSFRSDVQFNNNEAGEFGGGIAVDGGDVRRVMRNVHSDSDESI